jgi:hypothetical protein
MKPSALSSSERGCAGSGDQTQFERHQRDRNDVQQADGFDLARDRFAQGEDDRESHERGREHNRTPLDPAANRHHRRARPRPGGSIARTRQQCSCVRKDRHMD